MTRAFSRFCLFVLISAAIHAAIAVTLMRSFRKAASRQHWSVSVQIQGRASDGLAGAHARAKKQGQPSSATNVPADRPEIKSATAGDVTAALSPAYPLLSRRAGEEGEVELHLLIEPDGTVREAAVAKSSGFPRLDEAALDSARRARFSFSGVQAPSEPTSKTIKVRFDLR